MENNALIKVSGIFFSEETGDNIEITAKGKHYFKNNKHYVFYKEICEDDETIDTRIVFDENTVEVTRKGYMSGKLSFVKNKSVESIYSTPIGELYIEIVTGNIETNIEENEIGLFLNYSILVDGEKVTDSKLELKIVEHKKSDS